MGPRASSSGERTFVPDRHDRVNRIKDNRMRITIKTNATLKFQPVSHTHSQKKELEHVVAEPVVTTTRAQREGKCLSTAHKQEA